MRISAGQPAPDFENEDIFGKPVRLRDYAGSYLLLSFYRYASCPFCNLRLRELIERSESLSARGLHLVAVFQSPPESIARYVGRQDAPFPIIADPHHELYRRYGVDRSWLGFFKGSLNLPRLMAAMAAGFLPGKMEGDKALIPADFLIGPDGKVVIAYYGKDIADHLPLEKLDKLMSGPVESA